MARTKITADDCRSCGACCAADFAKQIGYVGLGPKDVERLSSRCRRLHVIQHDGQRGTDADGYGYLATKTTKAGDTVCIAFRGSIWTGRASCGIYDRRPDVCRAFKPGGEGCRFARRLAGWEA